MAAWILVTTIASGNAWAADPAEVAGQAREVLARRCVGCHSAAMKSSGLDLSSAVAAARGGSRGPGQILARVASGEMPPAKPLPEAEVEILRLWQAAGMPAWSSGAIALRRATADWWAFQPLRETTPPAGEVSGIDAWIEAKLRARSWQRAPEADRRTLIRRVSFTLTGMPPTPAEVQAFVDDRRPDAYARLVDRLLASPHYGEHWARHWLDTVRFAESEGFERDWIREHAWPYRDYVIRSFNADKPYAQFAREQIAGDVLTPPTRDGVVATSMLVLGPYDAVGLTSAVDREREQVRADQMEEMVGLVAQTFLGLTVNCARCHDHKFDPIPQRDYYRLKSVFEGIWQPTVGSELRAGGRAVLTAVEMAQHQEQLRGFDERMAALEAQLGQQARAGRPPLALPATVPAPVGWWTLDSDARDEAGALHASLTPEAATFAQGRLRPPAGKESVTAVTAPLTTDVREKTMEAWVHVASLSEKATTLLRIRNRSGFRGAAVDGIRLTGGKKRRWENESTVNFRTEDVEGPAEDTPVGGRIHVAVSYAANGEIRLYRNGKLYGRPYRPDAGTAHGLLQTYGRQDAVVELTSGRGFELEQARLFAQALNAEQVAMLYAAGVENREPAAGPEREELLRRLAEERAKRRALAEAPSLAFAAEVRPALPTRILARGDVSQPGETVAPAAVSLLRGLSGDLGLPPDAPDADRRRRFAEWLTSPENPLFARVIVNRVWHYHFGAGLVDSPNDFGYNGGEPSHPELLEWLTADFLRHGGSLKHLHRQILLSATFRQSSRLDSAAAAQDASARLLWRFPPQRLPAEAVRDAMLAVSGALNPTPFGPSFRPFEIIKNPGSYHSYSPVDSADPALQRRTIYRMNINSGGNPMLDALDCPLPSVKTPKRSVTTTPLQALSLMNNPFADRMARTFAARVSAERKDPAARIAWAYELALGRPPRPEEAASAAELAATAGLEGVCWALFNLSEFLYVP
ncbi:MAG: DUF1553 domain-containing protein [Acidobacteriaceae bacterium]|nr:DUF1553 domain-containing protein [Acidobacteriaceae bacterium]